MTDLLKFLRKNSYPGRGIVVGKDRVYYFIMGRSENSRNRVFALTEDGIRTEAHRPELMKDPSLIIYHPVRRCGKTLIVTNGDQTDTVAEALKSGNCARCALMSREYEPDSPNFTPRISAVIQDDGSFEISILKHLDGKCLREFFCYEGCAEGRGYFISTYEGDGSPLPSFKGEPIEVSMPEPEELWKALNEDNKVALYANVNGKVKLFNKHLGD
ncbi:MAG: inosine monophosphate cyclohydrolase [Clostridiales bacterium]|nr:inosine monophosphate cyclohydrolase [Clostridiales bacterium]